jgi:hypothetical protein
MSHDSGRPASLRPTRVGLSALVWVHRHRKWSGESHLWTLFGLTQLQLKEQRGVMKNYLCVASLPLRRKVMIRDSAEINFIGISIGILVEINFDFRRNYWLKLSKVIGILSLTVEIKLPISNKNRNFDLFQ